MEAIMNVKPHHTPKELQTLYRTEKNAKLARRIQGVYLASQGFRPLGPVPGDPQQPFGLAAGQILARLQRPGIEFHGFAIIAFAPFPKGSYLVCYQNLFKPGNLALNTFRRRRYDGNDQK